MNEPLTTNPEGMVAPLTQDERSGILGRSP
jgi:hypothetical protein